MGFRVYTLFLGSLFLFSFESYGNAEIALGTCREKNVLDECVLRELKDLSDPRNIVNNCLELGGMPDDFGTCLVDPAKFDKKPDSRDDWHQGLLAYVKKCESVATGTADLCNKSASMLNRARTQMDALNDMIEVHSSVSPERACSNMQNAVLASRVQLKAWQQTCGDALASCQHSCESTLIAVKDNAELSGKTRKAIQTCRAYHQQRDDVQRSIAMGSAAVEKSSLCRQQIGDSNDKRKQYDETRKPSETASLPAIPAPTSGSMPYSAPPSYNPGTTAALPQRADPYTTQPVRMPEIKERDVQGASHRPPTVAAQDNLIQSSEARKASQYDKNQKAQTANPVRFPGGVARETLAATNRAVNTARWPIPSQEQSRGSYAAVQPSSLKVVPAAVQSTVSAVKGNRILPKPTFGPITREPSSLGSRAFRSDGIAGQSADMFLNVRIQFIKFAASLPD